MTITIPDIQMVRSPTVTPKAHIPTYPHTIASDGPGGYTGTPGIEIYKKIDRYTELNNMNIPPTSDIINGEIGLSKTHHQVIL
jgi:hypothetical protein